MIQLAVKLGYSDFLYYSETTKVLKYLVDLIGIEPTTSCMPCKPQDSLNSHKCLKSLILNEINYRLRAHACSIMRAKEGVAGGKIGVRQGIYSDQFRLAQVRKELSNSILSSAQILNILNHHIKTTSRGFSGENYGTSVNGY